MKDSPLNESSRRRFLRGASSVVAASVVGRVRPALCAEPPPETKRIKLNAVPIACVAPLYVADALLKLEGFTQVEYVQSFAPIAVGSANGDPDLDLLSVGPILTALDAGVKVTMLAGMHLGCYELFGSNRVHRIRDLKDKSVPVDGLGGSQHVLLSSMAAYVGLDPRRDINWILRNPPEGMKLFAEGKADAYLAFPPEPYELRAKGIGNVIVNTASDKPWSQYHCCMLITHTEFVERYPVATKRAVRALLKAADLCTTDPEYVARALVEKKVTGRLDHTLETIREMRFDVWRSYNPDDAIRFHALRLLDIGMIRSTPQQLIARGTDWRFLNELKRELRA